MRFNELELSELFNIALASLTNKQTTNINNSNTFKNNICFAATYATIGHALYFRRELYTVLYTNTTMHTCTLHTYIDTNTCAKQLCVLVWHACIWNEIIIVPKSKKVSQILLRMRPCAQHCCTVCS